MNEFFVNLYEDSNVINGEVRSNSCDWCFDPGQCHGCNECHSCDTCNYCDGCYEPW